MPEPDLRNIAVAASRDVNHAPAILFDNIAGYPGKRTVVGVHGSWDNIALLLGQPKGTTIRDMFFDIAGRWGDARSEEHTSVLQSLMRISYAVFCLKKINNIIHSRDNTYILLLFIVTHSRKSLLQFSIT